MRVGLGPGAGCSLGRAEARPYKGVGRRVWNAFRRRPWSRSRIRQKSQDISPLRFASSKIAKNLGKFRPRAEAALEGVMVEFSEVMVGATGGDFMVSANSVAPIFE